LTLERLRERMVTLGATNEEVDEARRLLEDPSNTIVSPTSCLAQGRRPINSAPGSICRCSYSLRSSSKPAP
jgi:hypothetical protein